jgi:hypothetical protein
LKEFKLIKKSKQQYHQESIANCAGDQKKLYEIVDKLMCKAKTNPLPEYKNLPDILDKFGNFFDNKIKNLRSDLDKKICTSNPHEYEKHCLNILSDFTPCTEEEIKKIILK